MKRLEAYFVCEPMIEIFSQPVSGRRDKKETTGCMKNPVLWIFGRLSRQEGRDLKTRKAFLMGSSSRMCNFDQTLLLYLSKLKWNFLARKFCVDPVRCHFGAVAFSNLSDDDGDRRNAVQIFACTVLRSFITSYN